MKKIMFAFMLFSCILLFGCTKVEKYSSCEEMMVKAGPWEKKGNISTIYTFNEDGTGIAHLNSLDYTTTWRITEGTIYLHYAIDDITYDYNYSISCDLENHAYKITNSSGDSTEFVIKGTQVFEKLSGNKDSSLKGVWYSETGSAFVLDSDQNSGSGFYNTNDKLFYILTPYDWEGTNKELTLQNKYTGKETTYTYVIDNDILKLYSDGDVVGTYSHVKDGYKIETE